MIIKTFGGFGIRVLGHVKWRNPQGIYSTRWSYRIDGIHPSPDSSKKNAETREDGARERAEALLLWKLNLKLVCTACLFSQYHVTNFHSITFDRSPSRLLHFLKLISIRYHRRIRLFYCSQIWSNSSVTYIQDVRKYLKKSINP